MIQLAPQLAELVPLLAFFVVLELQEGAELRSTALRWRWNWPGG